MAKYLVYIETIGDPITIKGPVAHVPALPGASARGETIEEAKENVRIAIEEYLSLLRDVGEPVPKASEDIHLEFEEADTTTFLTDYDALHPNEMETLFRWMAVSRQELMDLVKGLPEEASDWQPDDAVKNGVLDFPLKSFQFEPRTPGEGVIYIDKVELNP